jgi:hypothetical protein
MSAVAVTVSGPRGATELCWPDDVALVELLGPVAEHCAGVPADRLAVVLGGQGVVDPARSPRALGLRPGAVVNVFPTARRAVLLPPAPPLRAAGPVPAGAAVPPSAVAPAHWCWVGAHGGAGVSTLQAALGGTEGASDGLPVVVVARSHRHGLTCAQKVARNHEGPHGEGPRPLGLVVVDDAPGRLPPALCDLARLVTGAYERSWRVPFDARLRTDPYDPAHLPRPLRRLLADLESLTHQAFRRS